MSLSDDFDFMTGAWQVHHRKLVDPLDPACHDWIEFDGTSEATRIRPVLVRFEWTADVARPVGSSSSRGTTGSRGS